MNSNSQTPTVFVVDDDHSSRDSLCALINTLGIATEAFSSAEEFLDSYKPDRRGCIVADIRMPQMTGDQLQCELHNRGISLPVIILTAYANTPLTVRVMQQGAVTLLEKPPHEGEIWAAIRKALVLDASHYTAFAKRVAIRERFDLLTKNELDVFREILAGIPNKQIAGKLDIGLRTAEARRHNIFQKMQVKSLAELVRVAIEADLNI